MEETTEGSVPECMRVNCLPVFDVVALSKALIGLNHSTSYNH